MVIDFKRKAASNILKHIASRTSLGAVFGNP